MIPTTARTLVASEAVTASGTSSTTDLLPTTGTQDDTLRLQLVVSAISSDTTLNVQVQTCDDGVSWQNVGQPAAVGAVGATPVVVAPVKRYVQATWAFTGGSPPSATFALAGVSTRPYANLGNLASQVILGQLYAALSPSDLDDEIMTACGKADDMLGEQRYTLPLLAWPKSLTDDVLALVAWNVLSGRTGFNPEGDPSVRMRFTDAMTSLKRASYAGVVDSAPAYEDDGGAFVMSDPPRGWGRTWP